MLSRLLIYNSATGPRVAGPSISRRATHLLRPLQWLPSHGHRKRNPILSEDLQTQAIFLRKCEPIGKPSSLKHLLSSCYPNTWYSFLPLPANTNICLLQTPLEARDCTQLEIYRPSHRGPAWPWDPWRECCLQEFKTYVEKKEGRGSRRCCQMFERGNVTTESNTHGRGTMMCLTKEVEQGGVGEGSGARLAFSWTGWVSSLCLSWWDRGHSEPTNVLCVKNELADASTAASGGSHQGAR